VQPQAPQQLLVLAGGGHTHALLLRRWAVRPRLKPAATQVLLVSRHSTALYSGMVPGLVAGLYQPDDCAIDLRRLCGQVGVTFVQAEITGLELALRELQLQGRPPLRWDVLSLDLGSVTAVADAAMAVKPLEPFLAWSQAQAPGSPLRIRGGGAGAVELALAFRARGLAPRLLLRGNALQLGSVAANRAGERLLAEAGIAVERQVAPQEAADLACTGSHAPAWLAASGLPVDQATGRVLTHASLQVLGQEWLFAVGDCGLIQADPRPASGVWAVRAAPVLAANLQQVVERPGTALRAWRPQARALQLLGDGGWHPGGARALAFYGPWALGPSRLLWRWKDRIDRQFMAGFSGLAAMAPAGGEPMACRGCAAKLPAAPLEAVLARLHPDGALPAAEDAALVGQGAGGEWLLQSVDGFPALVDDPWLNARLTTLHACSDLWASGAEVQSVQALVTLPQQAPALQETLLLQTLAGVQSVLDPMGARLIGGHTLEGRDGAGLSLALTVNGSAPPQGHWPKGPLQPGQVLVLTRPIGTGVLFAAAMAGAAEPGWLEQALALMQQSQAPLVALLRHHGCRACTDITGFGLLGHLGEMLAPTSRVQLDPGAIPALAGALPLLARGFASTLAPSNARALQLLNGSVELLGPADAAQRAAQLALLIDPQTCGPLLAALPADRAAEAVLALGRLGFPGAAVIGRVMG
jgi:selenide,water dikinase